MIRDALVLANPYLKIFESIEDPKRFMYLTDGILQSIEGSTQPELEKSRQLIRRIRKRAL